jgi:hypothetical protein
MLRIIAALFLLLASAAAASAQVLSPSVWQSQRGALLKVVAVDPATGNFHGSFCQRAGGHLSRSSLQSSRARSRPSGRIPDLEELDDRLQSDHGLVWTLCQPDDPRHERDRDIRGAKRSCGQSARHGSFPAHLSQVGFTSGQSKHSNTLGQAFGQ